MAKLNFVILIVVDFWLLEVVLASLKDRKGRKELYVHRTKSTSSQLLKSMLDVS